MIAFTNSEILFSMISALIYGAFYSVAMLLFRLFAGVLRGALQTVFRGFSHKGKIREFEKIEIKNDSYTEDKNKTAKEIFAAFSVILFSIGYILISYVSLDGVLRGYTLVLSILGFFLFSKYPVRFVERILCYFLEKLFNLLCLVLRLLFRPFLLIFEKIVKIINNFAKKSIFLHKSST